MIKTIHVTQGDIDEGIPTLPLHCPIARAAHRECTNPDITIGGYTFAWPLTGPRTPTGQTNVELPPSARMFVLDFDRNRSVEPFSFEIELPEGVCKSD